MNNMQLWIALGIPSFLVLLGILLNFMQSTGLGHRIDSVETRLTTDINTLRGEMNARFSEIDRELQRFHELLGEHSGKIELLARK